MDGDAPSVLRVTRSCAIALDELEWRFSASGGPGGPGGFGIGRFGAAAEAATEAVKLTAPVSPTVVLLAAGLAVLGGLLAGGIGAMRAARLRPADAMREVS